MVISVRRQKHLSPTIRHCPLFRGVRPCVWYAVQGRGEASHDQPIASVERQVTIIRSQQVCCWGSLVSILGSREIHFPGSRKKIETRDSRVSLTSLITTNNTFPVQYWNTARHKSLQICKLMQHSNTIFTHCSCKLTKI